MLTTKYCLCFVFVVMLSASCALYKLNTIDVTDYTEHQWRPIAQAKQVPTNDSEKLVSDEKPIQDSRSITGIEEKLKKLDTMKKNGLINEEEYQKLKDKIIDSY